MKTTLKKVGVISALSIAALGAVSASAMGFGGMGMNSTLSADEIATRQSTMFTQHASLIGASVDEVKNAWAEGKNFATLAKEKGVTEEQLRTKMQAQRTEQMKTHLATLVSKGVITQAQADKRIATMATQASKNKAGGKHGMRGGMGGGMMNGF